MNADELEDKSIYAVVINHEEQYSIWLSGRELPLGWREVGKTGSKQDCISYIEKVWVDMRPLSLRKKMAEIEAKYGQQADQTPESQNAAPEDSRDKLVEFLCTGTHPVEVILGPERNVAGVKEALSRGSIHVKFTDTQGGTELRLKLDRNSSVWEESDSGNQAGRLHLVGRLMLNCIDVNCIADIDLATFSGTGFLRKIESVS